jgi:putative transposase
MNPETRRRKSIRLQEYDYTQTGAYFVTICTLNREYSFGHVAGEEMVLSEAGRIVTEEWLKTCKMRPYVQLDHFVVMPNHFHGILILNDENMDQARQDTARRAPTKERFSKPVSRSLSSIVRAFKSAVTKRVNEWRATPGALVWQRGFYDHVIRDNESLNRIREYIMTNPRRWQFDQENLQRQGEDKFYRWLASFKDIPKNNQAGRGREK